MRLALVWSKQTWRICYLLNELWSSHNQSIFFPKKTLINFLKSNKLKYGYLKLNFSVRLTKTKEKLLFLGILHLYLHPLHHTLSKFSTEYINKAISTPPFQIIKYIAPGRSQELILEPIIKLSSGNKNITRLDFMKKDRHNSVSPSTKFLKTLRG